MEKKTPATPHTRTKTMHHIEKYIRKMRNQENKIDVNSNGRNKQRSGVEANNTEQKKI